MEADRPDNPGMDIPSDGIESGTPDHGFQFPGTFELSAMGVADRQLESELPRHLQDAGIEAIMLSPALGDFNEDLRILGLDALRAAIRVQIAPQDVARFMELAA